MQPQPYFPEAEELPGNAAGLDYDVRLGFIRDVIDRFTLSVLVVAAATVSLLNWAPDYARDLTRSALAALGALLVASTLRKIRLGGESDRLSIWVLPFILGTMARLAAALTLAGVRLELIPIAVLAVWLYRMMCGRDFSFLGLFTLGCLPLGVGWAILRPGWWGLLWGVMTLAYVSYDLAALLQRRRLNEAGLAVVDLYRDVLNFISYTFRVIHHWRNFRI
ncbi:MAG: hypothetical protein JNJ45_10415 [Chthonomonas sp.]|nr:hypothetical protein [Chthonomonas sp.]